MTLTITTTKTTIATMQWQPQEVLYELLLTPTKPNMNSYKIRTTTTLLTTKTAITKHPQNNWGLTSSKSQFDISLDISDQILQQSEDVDTVSKFFKVLRIVKIARSIRIFKLARHFVSLQVLAYTFKTKMSEFGLLFMFSTMGAISFSAVLYPLEKHR